MLNVFTDHLYTSFGTLITAPPLISTLYKSLQNPLNIFQPTASYPAVPWQRFLTEEILGLPVLTSFLRRLSCRTSCQLFLQLNCIAICSKPPLQSSTAHSTTKPHLSSFIITLYKLNRKHCSQHFLCCCLRTRYCGYLFTEPLPNNGHVWLHY
jgi:hypothetical protein